MSIEPEKHVIEQINENLKREKIAAPNAMTMSGRLILCERLKQTLDVLIQSARRKGYEGCAQTLTQHKDGIDEIIETLGGSGVHCAITGDPAGESEVIEKFEQLVIHLQSIESQFTDNRCIAHNIGLIHESGYYLGGSQMCEMIQRWIRENVPGVTIESSNNTAAVHPSDLPSSERTASGSDSEAG